MIQTQIALLLAVYDYYKTVFLLHTKLLTLWYPLDFGCVFQFCVWLQPSDCKYPPPV